MRRRSPGGKWRAGACLVGVAVLLGGCGASAASPPAADAGSRAVTIRSGRRLTCSSGVIPPGSYRSIVVTGTCRGPQSGTVTIVGPLTVAAGASLDGNYAPAAKGGPEGGADWVVVGEVTVERGATLFLGCGPYFGCRVTTRVEVDGDVVGLAPLGIVLHDDSVHGNVTVTGGGGGLDCTPRGVFRALDYPVYTDVEDSNINGNLTITALVSCWLGVARDRVNGSVLVRADRLKDPDAIEILSNTVTGDLTCVGDTPVWDNRQVHENGPLYPRSPRPNTVLGARRGTCVSASPDTRGGRQGPAPF